MNVKILYKLVIIMATAVYLLSWYFKFECPSGYLRKHLKNDTVSPDLFQSKVSNMFPLKDLKNIMQHSSVSPANNTISGNFTPDQEMTSVFYNVGLRNLPKRRTDGTFVYLTSMKNPCWVGTSNTRKKIKTLHCLPFFYVLGVAKSGTTDVFSLLVKHPHISKPSQKELLYWHRFRFKNYEFRRYLGQFGRVSKNILEGKNESITFDNSPSYFWDFPHWKKLSANHGLPEPLLTLPHTLYSLSKETKYVILLRNPVDRLYSHFNHFITNHNKSRDVPTVFHPQVMMALSRMLSCLKSSPRRACVLDPKSCREVWPLFIRAGMYVVQMKDWMSVIPRHQFLVIKAEEYYADRKRIFAQLLRHLGLDQNLMPEEGYNQNPANARTYKPMLNITRQLLTAFYRPFNIELAEFLGDKTFIWE